MGWGINSLLNMGNGALFASQASIQTTGNNIANVDTQGYSRQKVNLQDRYALDSRPGQVGQGVEAKEVIRYFDKFVESAYLDKASLKRRYDEEYGLLRNVETVFNESNVKGISSALTEFYNAWSKLAQEPDSQAARAALLEKAQTLSTSISSADKTLEAIEEQMDGMIREEVDRANDLIKQIAELNREINAHTISGRNNANSLMDQRDKKVRELSEILDIKVQDRGAGNYNITTGAGLLLVQEDIANSLQFNAPRTENNLTVNSTYDGTVGFSGKDGYEYTVDIVEPGTVDSSGKTPPSAGTAQYRVSLDGGRTWMKDAQGNDQLFFATDDKASAHVKDLDIYFTGTNMLTKGDRFLLTPKSDVYWHSSTAGVIDISTQIYGDGTDNDQRITGGTLGGFLEFRDNKIGQYRDNLAGFANTVAWEVNRIHSQGSGINHFTSVLGEYQVKHTDMPLGSRSSGNHWFDKLQAGNVSFAIYDAATNKPVIPYPGIDVFSPANFDPSKHSLEDVAAAINTGPASAYLKASIVDNRLEITSDPQYTFGVATDTAGLSAALGINTFFKGTSAASLAVRDELIVNTNFINAGRINGAGEGNLGDNLTAKEIALLASKRVDIDVVGRSSTKQTMTDFWASLVTRVGADTANIKFVAATEGTMARELHDRSQEISGVSLDEEMSNLIKFQSSYKAAAKLITTADQMIQTILSLKN